jgi:putative nucleotidyltransferase with HDIG domain
MQKQQLDQLKEWFAGYVRRFYTPGDDFLNNNLHLKECHTRRVCAEMRQLAESLKMNENDSLLAESIALLHDIGRFEQFKKYRTYKDTVSENHCLLGLRIIAEHNLLDTLSPDEHTIIRDAIEFHGAKELPVLEERTLHFAKMIRDVDKLDIFCLCAENYRRFHEDKKSFAFEVEFPDIPDVTPEILEAILNNQLIDYRLLKTLTDAKLLQLGWVFDTYFDWTLRQMRDRGYIEGIMRWLPKTNVTERAVRHITAYITERLGWHGAAVSQ